MASQKKGPLQVLFITSKSLLSLLKVLLQWRYRSLAYLT